MRLNLFPSNYLENESNPEVKLVYFVLIQAYPFPGWKARFCIPDLVIRFDDDLGEGLEIESDSKYLSILCLIRASNKYPIIQVISFIPCKGRQSHQALGKQVRKNIVTRLQIPAIDLFCPSCFFKCIIA